MGTYSSVHIMCESNAFEMFEKVLAFNESRYYQISRSKSNPAVYLISWDWIKWNSWAPLVHDFEEIMSELYENHNSEEGYIFHFIRVGEDNQTEEKYNGQDYTNYFPDFEVIISVCIPDDMEIIKGEKSDQKK